MLTTYIDINIQREKFDKFLNQEKFLSKIFLQPRILFIILLKQYLVQCFGMLAKLDFFANIGNVYQHVNIVQEQQKAVVVS